MRKPMDTPELLTALLTASGPSGHEEEPARRLARGRFGVRRGDVATRSARRSRVSAGERRARPLAIVGHIDEIGIAVTNIEESGLLSFTTIGGIAAEMLHGQRIELADPQRAGSPVRSRASASSRDQA